MEMFLKEQVYDDKIYPLMDEIISICKEHKIAMLCSFAIPTEDNPGLACTTALLGSDFDPPKELLKALGNILGSYEQRSNQNV